MCVTNTQWKTREAELYFTFNAKKDHEEQKNRKTEKMTETSWDWTKYLRFLKTELRIRLQLREAVLAWEMFQFYSKYHFGLALYHLSYFSCTETDTQRF